MLINSLTMSDPMQDLINIFAENRHQEVVDSVDFNTFSPSDNPVISKIVAASLFKLGDYVRSLSLLSQIESCFIEDAEYLSLYGACLRRNGDLDQARIQFELALKIDPDSLYIQNNFANLLIDIGDFNMAEEILQKILSREPAYADATMNLQRLVEKKKAAKSMSANSDDTFAWSLGDPLLLAFSNEEVQRTSSDLFSKKNPENGKNVLADALPPVKGYQIASDFLNAAQKAILEKRYSFALQLCSQSKQSLSDNPAIYECASDAYIALSSFKEAEICLLHAIQLGLSSFKIFVNLVSLSCMRGDYSLAQFYFERAQAIDSEHSSIDHLRRQIVTGRQAADDKFFRFDKPWSTPIVP